MDFQPNEKIISYQWEQASVKTHIPKDPQEMVQEDHAPQEGNKQAIEYDNNGNSLFVLSRQSVEYPAAYSILQQQPENYWSDQGDQQC